MGQAFGIYNGGILAMISAQPLPMQSAVGQAPTCKSLFPETSKLSGTWKVPIMAVSAHTTLKAEIISIFLSEIGKGPGQAI